MSAELCGSELAVCGAGWRRTERRLLPEPSHQAPRAPCCAGNASATGSFCRRLARRLLSMAAAWFAVGAMSGLHTGLRLGDAGAVLAYTIAGMAVFSILGSILGLFAARARESLLGATCGMLVGLLATLFRPDAPPDQAINLCLVIGGLIGATSWPWISTVLGAVRILLRAALRLARGAERVIRAPATPA